MSLPCFQSSFILAVGVFYSMALSEMKGCVLFSLLSERDGVDVRFLGVCGWVVLVLSFVPVRVFSKLSCHLGFELTLQPSYLARS